MLIHITHVLPHLRSDPHGPIYWRGRYHLFYQSTPGTCQVILVVHMSACRLACIIISRVLQEAGVPCLAVDVRCQLAASSVDGTLSVSLCPAVGVSLVMLQLAFLGAALCASTVFKGAEPSPTFLAVTVVTTANKHKHHAHSVCVATCHHSGTGA